MSRQFPRFSLQSQTWKDISALLGKLPAQRKRLVGFVLLASFFQGILDLLLIAFLARFVGLFSGAKLADRLPGIWVFGGGILDQTGWLLALLIASFWLTSFVRFLVSLMQSLLSAEIWNDLVNQVYQNVLQQRYEFFIENRTANLSEKFNRILNSVSTKVVIPLIAIAGNALSVTSLLIGVVFVLGYQALAIFLLMLMAYALASVLITPYLRLATKQRVRYGRRINLLLMESLRSIRDVHLYSADKYFVTRFSSDGVIAKRYDRLTRLLPDVPRFLIEPAGISILFLVGLAPAVLNGDPSDVRNAIPDLFAIMFTLLKISGPLQNTFRSLNRLRGGLPEIKDALDLLDLKSERLLLSSPGVPTPEGLLPRRLIQLKDVSFSYRRSEKLILDSINISIPIGSRFALVGRTGSGKTTIAHLLLGLLKPSSGELMLDGIPVSAQDLPAWQANCALVPQDIRLFDGSIRDNVAFGLDNDLIDDEDIWAALKTAQFDDVVAQMPYGLYTMIGENGVKLSGGQRQRLALARAFYRGAKVLVLDEATSALDNRTEHDVLQALDLVGRRCTTIVIAHRLSTVKKCDRIVEIENGRIHAQGDFVSLCESSETFRDMYRIENT
ncbi:ABC transporter ATP-binding protein [Synechococcus sp. YX-04-1]|uniref:ABC transporter ATP-binding protein n=1 Tax=Synechococcus sp. YX-04-1 TaxID=3062778 RepID=UPI0026E40BFB|nr:ABC transporter ATP-binding protein [Synechococcus sp. YX-04-1]MDO6351058.1 ABC transporter ATP-binding protein [Synechococcus sp. YX-04-1]